MTLRLNRKIPGDVLMDNIVFFDNYRMKIGNTKGMLFKCDEINYDKILSYGNTVPLITRCEYAPEIEHKAIFVADKLIKEDSLLYNIFINSRKQFS